MPHLNPPVRLADEEAAFWRGFIERWRQEREGPVPQRAWEALSHAEEKRRALDADCRLGGSRPDSAALWSTGGNGQAPGAMPPEIH